MHYPAGIPPLPPLASAAGQAQVGAAAAGGIAAGSLLDLANVNDVDKELRNRKRIRSADPNQATPAEVASARVRKHAVLAIHASQTYAGDGAPAWFAPAMADALAPLRNELRHMESRAVSRSYNATIKVIDTPLYGLVGNNGAVPAHFPADISALRTLTPARVNGLLTAYGQPHVGDAQARKVRLANFIGANHY